MLSYINVCISLSLSLSLCGRLMLLINYLLLMIDVGRVIINLRLLLTDLKMLIPTRTHTHLHHSLKFHLAELVLSPAKMSNLPPR